MKTLNEAIMGSGENHPLIGSSPVVGTIFVETFVDISCGKRELLLVMRQQKRAASKNTDYPEETPGSRLAAKARKLANKLTPEQRREHFNGAMAMIYGGAKEAAIARH
jgi:hypothetical protein